MASLKIIFDAQISKAMAAIERLTQKNEESKKKMERPAESGPDRRSALEEVRTRKVEAEAAKRAKAETQAAIKAQAATVREAEAAVKAADEKSTAHKKATAELERQRKELERLKTLGKAQGQAADIASVNLHRSRQAARVPAPAPQTPAQPAGSWFSRISTAGAKAAAGIETRFAKMKSRVGSIFSGLSGVVTGTLAAFGIGFGVATIKKTIDDLDNLGKSARNMGVSAEDLQKFQHAANSVNFPVEQIQPSFDKMRKIVGDAFNGVPDAQKKIAMLGISMDELKGKSTSEQFDLISGAILGIKDPTEQATAAMSIFGEQGAKLLNFMREYKQSGADLEARGGVISNDDIAAAEAFNQACTNVAASLRGWAVNSGFIKQLQEVAEGLDAMATNAAKLKSIGGVETNQESGFDSTMRHVNNGLGGLIGMGTLWGDKGLGDLLNPKQEGLYVAAPEKGAAQKANEEKKKRQEEEAARAKKREEEKAKTAREKAQKADETIDNQVADLERKASGKSDSKEERRKAAIEQEVTKAERTAKAQGVELAPEKRAKVEKAAAAVFDAEESKKDADGKQKIDDQIDALEEKYKVQQMINEGKGREAAIQQEIDKAEKTARDSGVEFTEEQRQRVASAAGANYDQEEARRGTEKSNITGPVNNVYSDSLLRMGGVLGSIGAGQTDYTKKSSQTLDTLQTKVGMLYDKIPNRTENTELEF